MRRRSPLFIALLLAGLAVLGAGAYAAVAAQSSSHTASATRASLFRVSVHGTPVPLPPGRPRESLEASGYGPVYLVGTRGKRNFLRIERSDGGACYGSGKAGAAWPIGRFICQNAPATFPSPERPILDFSLAVGANDGPVHFDQVEGVAADGVAAINVVDQAGNTILCIPVEGNFYSSGAADLGANAVRLEAVDASGSVVAAVPGQLR